MITYFIKVVAFQLLFLLSYDLFLKKETFFNWNRVYLICSSLISFVLPFIKIESFQKAVPQEYIILLPEIVLTPEKTVAPIEPAWNWFLIIGIAISSILFIYKIVELLQLRFKGRFIKRDNYTIILIPKSTVAFSIFRYVFIGDDIHETKLEDILLHELVHVREKHSLDLLYFELLRILCWFNPLVYIYQKRISEIHEYIADAVIVQDKDKSDYYEKLLTEVFQTQQFSFTNQFFKHSLIKKRIIMLTKQKSKEILKLKYLVLVPILVFSLFYTSFSTASTTDIEYVTESVDPGDKEAKLKKLYKRLNELNQSLKDDEYFTRAQYDEVTEILSKISRLVGKEGKLTTQDKAQLYEEYLEIRKKRIAESGNNNELQKDPVLFQVIDKAPVFPGCESSATLEELKECFILNVQKHVNENFDMKMAGKLELGDDVQKIYAKFIIDKNGVVTDMNVRAPHPDLVTEVERILLMLPKLVPGEKDGKSVSIKYLLPIAFKIAK